MRLIPTSLLVLTFALGSGAGEARAQPIPGGPSEGIPGISTARNIIDSVDFNVMGGFDLPTGYGVGMRATWWSFLDGGLAGRGFWSGLNVDLLARRMDVLVRTNLHSDLDTLVQAGLDELGLDALVTSRLVEQGALLLWWVASNWGEEADLRVLTTPLVPLLQATAGELGLPTAPRSRRGLVPAFETRRRPPEVPGRMLEALELVPRNGSASN